MRCDCNRPLCISIICVDIRKLRSGSGYGQAEDLFHKVYPFGVRSRQPSGSEIETIKCMHSPQAKIYEVELLFLLNDDLFTMLFT